MLYQLFSTESNYLFLLQITYTFIYIENGLAFKYLLQIVISSYFNSKFCVHKFSVYNQHKESEIRNY